nr:hypothetical protein [Tanacetum cinerariifolium]
MKKLGIHPKEAIFTKADELFKKAQDAEHEVLKRQHTKKVRLSFELKKHKIFVVHKPFLFGAFGISELDELREIIPNKKNTVVAELMNSLSQRKQKHIELEPETRIPRLECNRTLPNNMVIEEPEYEIFFTDEFGDQAFQRWSDIDKVRMLALVSYLVAASVVKSLENASVRRSCLNDINKMTDTLEPEETGTADCSFRGKIKSSSGRLRGSLLAVHKIKAESIVNQVEAKRLIQKVKSLKKNDLLDMLVPRMLR